MGFGLGAMTAAFVAAFWFAIEYSKHRARIRVLEEKVEQLLPTWGGKESGD